MKIFSILKPSFWKQALFKTSKEIDSEEVSINYQDYLLKSEEVKISFELLRDKMIFTNKRLIFIDHQGLTGKKIRFKSVPYSSIISYQVETAGKFDMDSELVIYLSGNVMIEKKLGKKVDVQKLQRIITLMTIK